MVRFEELQELWQNQPQPQAFAVAAESRGMAAALRRFRHRQYVINGIKLAVIVWVTWSMLSRPGISVLTVLGLGMGLAGMVNAVVTDWRIQSAIARLDFTRPSVGFIDTTLERLRDPNAPFRRTGWLGIALLAGGINLMLAGPSATETFASRIASHAAATFFPFAAFAFGLKLRAKRYALEYKPLVEQMAAMKAALEEHAQ
ncbi:MAG TPA: hypothetical protein VH640_28665 [Bryobacteraceae bacterium]|jgi:hypothetical protein